jgi:hypothetical protein
MTAMKHSILGISLALFCVVTLLSACTGSGENSASSNNNSNSQQAAAQDNESAAPKAGAPIVVPMPAPQPPAAQPAPAPEPNAPAAANASSSKRLASGPKLVAPEKKLDFGKQSEDKTLIRAISIRNGGRALLNIESVTPS